MCDRTQRLSIQSVVGRRRREKSSHHVPSKSSSSSSTTHTLTLPIIGQKFLNVTHEIRDMPHSPEFKGESMGTTVGRALWCRGAA